MEDTVCNHTIGFTDDDYDTGTIFLDVDDVLGKWFFPLHSETRYQFCPKCGMDLAPLWDQYEKRVSEYETTDRQYLQPL